MPAKLAAALALSLAAASATAQPPPPPAEPAQEQEADGGLGGDSVAYYVLPLLIVIALLVAVLNEGGDAESP